MNKIDVYCISQHLWLSFVLVILIMGSCTLLPTSMSPRSNTPNNPSHTPDKDFHSDQTPSPKFTSEILAISTDSLTIQATAKPSRTVTSCYSQFSDLPPGQYLVYEDGGEGSYAIDVTDKIKHKIPDKVDFPFRSNGRQMCYVDGGLLDWKTGEFYKIELEACGQYSISPNLDMAVAACQISADISFDKKVVVYSLKEGTQTVLLEREESGYIVFDPQWSPDGKWLSVFLAHLDRGPVDTDLGSPDAGFYLFDTTCLPEPQTCSEKQHGPFRALVDIMYSYSWSPDSRYVAFNASGGEGFEILDVQSGKYKTLRATDGYGSVQWKSWSPDGEWLAYIRQESASDDSEDIYLVPLFGGRSIHLIDSADEANIWGWITVPWPMRIGEEYIITQAGENLNLRIEPSLSSVVVNKLKPGDRIILLGGPVGADGYQWWKMRIEESGIEGWAVEIPDWYEPVNP